MVRVKSQRHGQPYREDVVRRVDVNEVDSSKPEEVDRLLDGAPRITAPAGICHFGCPRGRLRRTLEKDYGKLLAEGIMDVRHLRDEAGLPDLCRRQVRGPAYPLQFEG